MKLPADQIPQTPDEFFNQAFDQTRVKLYLRNLLYPSLDPRAGPETEYSNEALTPAFIRLLHQMKLADVYSNAFDLADLIDYKTGTIRQGIDQTFPAHFMRDKIALVVTDLVVPSVQMGYLTPEDAMKFLSKLESRLELYRDSGVEGFGGAFRL